MTNTPHSARVALTLAIVLGVGMSLSGCAPEPANGSGDSGSSQSGQDAATDSGEKAPAQDAGSKGFTDKDGLVPDWVAEGFPIHPNSASAGAGEAGGDTIISFSVPKVTDQDLYDWFVEQYSQNGWEIYSSEADLHNFRATNIDGRKAYINVTQSTFVMAVSQG